MTSCHVAIIGAGPYGLSIAAHLAARGVEFRIFGRSMHTWLTRMPRGMRLKSAGFASSLSDPDGEFTLRAFCQRGGLPYADLAPPVSLETFTSYGLEFQRKFVPQLEDKAVISLRRSPGGFLLELENGEVCSAHRVIVGVGLTHFDYIPPFLSVLPPALVTHSSAHYAVDQFAGRAVAVIGAGASAFDLASLLHQVDADVQLIARTPAIRFHDAPGGKRSLYERVRWPNTGLSPGWHLVFCSKAPLVFHRLPQQYRLNFVHRVLGPAPGWFTRSEVEGKVPMHLGVNVTGVKVRGSRVHLELLNRAGERRSLVTDHVIAATGYRVDLRRLTFMSSDLRSAVHAVDQTPILSSKFESSVPGLYFVGIAAANSFGPLLRFVFGAKFTARRLTRHLAGSESRKSIPLEHGEVDAFAGVQEG
jgi:thioredoxin reductase